MKHKPCSIIVLGAVTFLLLGLGCYSHRQASPKAAVSLYELSTANELNENAIEEIASKGAIYRIKAGEVFSFKVSASGDVFVTQVPAILEFHFKKDSYLYIPPEMKDFGDLQISHDGEKYQRLSTLQKQRNISFDLEQLKDGISANLNLQYFSTP